MRFWTWKPIIMACAIASSIYLTILGFQGNLPHFMGAFGWLLVCLNISLDLLKVEVEYKKRGAQTAFDAALSAHFDRQDCCCEKDCVQCAPNKCDEKKEE